jgi:hypothetical protein
MVRISRLRGFLFAQKTLSPTIQQLLYLVLRQVSTSAAGKVQAEEQVTIDIYYRASSCITQMLNESATMNMEHVG